MVLNTAPIASADSNTAKEAGGIGNGSLGFGATGNVLLNDRDADFGAALHVSAIRANNGNVGIVGQRLTGSSGYLTLNADGSYSYQVREGQRDALDTGDVATDRFTYTVMDEFGATSTAVLTITVQGTNDAAVASSISATIGKQSAGYTGQATATDVDDSVHSFRLVGDVPQGVVFNANGSFTVAPLASDQSLGVGATRIVSFQYVANDGEIDSAPATVSITITGSNAPPVAGNDSNTAREAGGIANSSLGYGATGNVLTNDSDADGNGLLVSAIRSNSGTVGAVGVRLTGSHGYLTLNADGSYVYQIREAHRDALDTGDVGTDRFVYTVSDGQGGTSQATLTFTVLGSNDAAVAANISATISEDSVSYKGQATATDVDDTVHSFRLVDAAPDGVVFNSDGSFTVVPTEADQAMVAGESRIVSFQYVANDGEIDSAPATITITINGVDDTATISGDSSGRVIEAGVDYDDQPIAGATSVSGSLTVVDADRDQAGIQAQTDVAGQYGSFSIDGSGQWTYTLGSGAEVEGLSEEQEPVETFVVYSVDGSASQAISITIQGSNDDPYLVAEVAGAAITEDSGASLTSSGSFTFDDPESGNIHGIVGITGAAGNSLGGQLTASLTAAASGTGIGRVAWQYQLANSAAQGLGAGDSVVESFTVSVSDGLGGQLDQVIDVVVHGVNDTASLSGDFSGTASENGPGASGTIVVSDLDDGESGTRAQTGASGHYGSFSIGTDGQWSYSADNGNSLVNSLTSGDSVIDSFTVYSTDGSASQTVSITIQGQNDAPQAVDDSASATEGGISISGSVATNDSDAEGSSLSYSLDGCDAPAGLTLNADGSYVFDPTVGAYDHLAAGASEQVSVQVLVSDGHNTSSSTLTITVTGSNDGPVAVDDSACATEGGASISGSVATNDSDADDGASLSYSLTAPVAGLTLNADGSYSFDPTGTAYDHIASGSSATVTASYTVTDEHGASDTGTLTITLSGSNDSASISGNATGRVTEAGGVDNGIAGIASASGSLSVTDPDDGESAFQASCGSQASIGGYGQYSIDASGQWSYQLDNLNATVQGLRHNQTLSDSFTVYSADGSASQSVSITITGRNDAPYIISADGSAGLTEDSGVLGGQLGASGSIVFDDHETLNFHAVSVTAAAGNSYSGVLSAVLGTAAQGSGSGQIGWNYSIDNSSIQGLGDGQSVVEHYSIVIADSAGASRVQDIAITLNGSNDGIQIGEGGSISGSLKEDDSASIGGSFSFSDADQTDTHTADVSDATHGTATAEIASDSTGGASGSVSWTYTVDSGSSLVQSLAVGESLVDSFTISLDDGHGGTTSQVIQVVIDGQNDAPDLLAQERARKLGDFATGQSFSLGFSDADLSDSHSVTAGSAGHGSVSVSIGSAATGSGSGQVQVDYTVSASIAGTLSVGESLADSFTVTLTDSQGASNTETVQVVIHGVNDAPVVISYSGDDNNIVTEDQGVVSGQLRDSGTISYNDADLRDTHSVTVNAGSGNSLGGSLTTTLVSSAEGASIGQISYQYSVNNSAVQHLAADEVATEVFSIVIADTHGGSVVQSVVMSVQGRNDAPVGVNDSATLHEDSASMTASLASGVLANDTDVDNGHILSVTSVRTGAVEGQGTAGLVNVALMGQYGSLTLSADGSYTYVRSPDQVAAAQALGAGDSLVDSFNYTVSDGTLSDRAVLNIVIEGVNDAPKVNEGITSGSVSEDTAGTIAGSFTVTDVDAGRGETFGASFSAAAHGTASASVSGGTVTWTYDVDNAAAQSLGTGQSLADSFTVTVSDADGGSVSQVIHVTVNGVNDAPVASNATGSGQHIGEDSTGTLSGGFSVTDAEHQVLQASKINGAYGTVTATLGASGAVSWSYDLDEANSTVQALNAGQSMADSFTVTVSDSQGGTVVQTINVVIDGADDGPFQVFKLGADLQSVEVRWPTDANIYKNYSIDGAIGPDQAYTQNRPAGQNPFFLRVGSDNQTATHIARVEDGAGLLSGASPDLTNITWAGSTFSLGGGSADDFLFRGQSALSLTFTGGGGDDTYVNIATNGTVGTASFQVTAGHDTIHGLDGGHTLEVSAGASVTAYVYGNISVAQSTGLSNNGSAELILKQQGQINLGQALGSQGWSLRAADDLTAGVFLTGSMYADTLQGSAGNDVLDGGMGADIFIASAGTDVFLLGAGSDSDTVHYSGDYVLESSALVDTIFNFQAGTDKIDLQDLLDALEQAGGSPSVLLQYGGNGTGIYIQDASALVKLAEISGVNLANTNDLIVGDHVATLGLG